MLGDDCDTLCRCGAIVFVDNTGKVSAFLESMIIYLFDATHSERLLHSN